MTINVTVSQNQTARVKVETQRVAEVTAVGIQGPPGTASSLEAIENVKADNAPDGSVLVKDAATGNWIGQTLLEKQTMNGGFF